MEPPRVQHVPYGHVGRLDTCQTPPREAKEDWARLTLHPPTRESKGQHSPGTRRGLGAGPKKTDWWDSVIPREGWAILVRSLRSGGVLPELRKPLSEVW